MDDRPSIRVALSGRLVKLNVLNGRSFIDTEALQTYLKLRGVEFSTVPSNNHSSPTGSLPFLLPPISRTPLSTETPLPITSNKLEKWARDHGHRAQTGDQIDVRYDAYLSLIENQIRNAWVRNAFRM